MKRLYLLLIALVAAWTASANPVDRESAQQKATKFILGNKALARGQLKIRLASASDAYYVFNIADNGGFVIVSGDDATPEILGYSKSGTFDSQKIPDNMRSFLESLEQQILTIQTRGIKAVPQKTVNGAAIAPLLGDIAFNQGHPYNQNCPDGENTQKCVTGCVATAMAQVMRYWQHPNQSTQEIPDYTIDYYDGSSTTFPGWGVTTIDWANMLSSYNGNESQTQINAVATLMALCGASVEMVYGVYGSSASTSYVPHALKTYFDYDAGTRFIERLYYRAAEWNQTIYDELLQNRPVIYGGQSSGTGHAFVVDGYDCDDFFHINWGWGGYLDNYFLLSILDPDSSTGIGASSSSDGYSFGQDAVIGIQPSTGNAFKERVALTTSNFYAYQEEGENTQKSFSITRTSAAEDFTINIANVRWNFLDNPYTFDIGFGAYNSTGALVTDQLLFYVDLDPRYGGEMGDAFDFGAGLPDGTYTIVPISRENGASEWNKDIEADNYSITAIISGNTLTIRNAFVDLTGTIKATGVLEVNVKQPLAFTITNNGSFFNKEVFLLVDGKCKGGRVIEIEASGNATGSFSFLPEATGTYTVALAYVNGYDVYGEPIYQTFISAPITVGETIPGDANDDGSVDANDIVAIINFLMGKDVPGFNADKADANGDGSINAADIVTIVGKIL